MTQTRLLEVSVLTSFSSHFCTSRVKRCLLRVSYFPSSLLCRLSDLVGSNPPQTRTILADESLSPSSTARSHRRCVPVYLARVAVDRVC